MSELEELRELVKQQAEKIASLEAMVAELLARLNQNSQNSSIPPSKDINRKKSHKRNSRSRQPSKKKQGGQKGHKGSTLQFSDEPDKVIEHKPTVCEKCQSQLESGKTVEVSKRQVFDIPPVKMVVTEHQQHTISCPCCGKENKGIYPKNVKAPVQYGENIQQFVLYQRIENFIPFGRLAQMIRDIYGCTMSVGTIINLSKKIAKMVEPIVGSIKESIINSDQVHADESGYYMEGNRQWIHVACTDQYTHYTPHSSRGRVALEHAGILPKFKGLLIHDSYAMYWNYGNRHALCNAHLLRELQGISENDETQSWAIQMMRFLQWIWHHVKKYREQGNVRFTEKIKQSFSVIYDQIVRTGEHQNPLSPKEKGKRGRQKKTKSRNLLERFQGKKEAIIGFIMDWNIPFDNNLAERDVRMMKLQQKISGCFRSEYGAESFCLLRSYTSTMKKQNQNCWQAIGSLIIGEPILPVCLPKQ